jgi:hypothetical protein
MKEYSLNLEGLEVSTKSSNKETAWFWIGEGGIAFAGIVKPKGFFQKAKALFKK